MRHYTKTFRSHADQLSLLKERGLSIGDVVGAEKILESINYYRFTGYALPFMIDREHFRPNATFEDVLAICRYDAKLRDLLFEALEAIELDFRARFAYSFSRMFGALGYRKPVNFRDGGAHAVTLAKIDAEISRSKEKCIQHFQQDYYPSEIPIWAVVEVLSFGTLVGLYNNLRVDGAKEISKSYGIKWNILGSYLQHLSVLRNFCAHHSRLYDRKFYKFRPLNEWRTTHPGLSDTGAFFYQAVLCHRLSVCVKSTCFDRDSWRQRICQAFASAPRILCFDLPGLMGIPADPARSSLWV